MLFPEFARDGGLIGYGPDLQDLFRSAGIMARRVIDGTPPAEVPVERPVRLQPLLSMCAPGEPLASKYPTRSSLAPGSNEARSEVVEGASLEAACRLAFLGRKVLAGEAPRRSRAFGCYCRMSFDRARAAGAFVSPNRYSQS